MLRSKLILPGLVLALAGGAFAQGDDCSTAAALTGTGYFAYDTSGFTESFFDGGGTCAAGASTMNIDGFFQWTAPAAGDYLFDTFGTSYDTKLSVHTGVGCAATCADYNDDTNGLQSEVSLAGLAAGDMVLIQLGGFGATHYGPGSLNITSYVAPPPAQNDDCSTAGVVTGMGPFPFDTTGATTSGFDGGGGTCPTNLNQDIFMQWTAPTAGGFSFDTFTAAFDTQLSVHTGIGCAAVCGDYNDDAGGGLQSEVFLSGLAAGDMVLIQVGGFGTYSGVGDVTINPWVDPCAVPDDIYEENDDCGSAAAMVDGTFPGLFVSSTDMDHYSFSVANGATVDIDALFLTATADLDIVLWDALDPNCGTGHAGGTFLAEGFSGSDNENISWTNTTGADLPVILEVNIFFGDCNIYDLVLSGADPGGPGSAGSAFCDPANNNSTGAPTVLAGNWGSGVGSDLHLDVTGGIPGELCYLLAGNEATVGIPVSNGQFCLVGTTTAQFFRYNVAGTEMSSIGSFDATGTMVNAVGTSTTGFGFDVPSTIPALIPITIMAGDTWHFQAWFRDTPAGVGSSNFSNGLSVNF